MILFIRDHRDIGEDHREEEYHHHRAWMDHLLALHLVEDMAGAQEEEAEEEVQHQERSPCEFLSPPNSQAQLSVAEVKSSNACNSFPAPVSKSVVRKRAP